MGLSEKLKEKFAGKGKVMIAVGGGLVVVLATLAFALFSTAPGSGRHPQLGQAKHGHQQDQAHSSSHAATASHGDANPGLMELIVEALINIQRKVEHIKRAEATNLRLRQENANLRRWAEALRFDCSYSDAEDKSKQVGLKLHRDTGAYVGRVLASIPYTPPGHLLPAQLYTLGVSYFKAEEYEKAAVIFTYLADMEEDTFRNPRDILIAGVAWYRLDHFKLADVYFARVLKFLPTPEALPYQAQARLWRALRSERTSQHQEVQSWLRELVDHHPHATETSWVNSAEGQAALHRSLAGQETVEETSTTERIDGEGHGSEPAHRAHQSTGGGKGKPQPQQPQHQGEDHGQNHH